MAYSPAAQKDLQRDLNKFTKRFLPYVNPLQVDGKPGKLTRRRVRSVKWWLGIGGTQNAKVTKRFRQKLSNPRSRKFATLGELARGVRRRSASRRHFRRNKRKAHRTTGVGSWGGRPVANWLIPYLDYARKHGWQGGVNSGWRDPKYSESLCYRMCGRPSCSGRCAGRSSHHSGSTRPAGAIDVSGYGEFGQIMRRCPLEPRIYNALGARDPVHFSATGN